MQNDKDMMAVADKYMSDYMSGPVHEINKLTAKKGSSLMKKLKNPPAYKTESIIAVKIGKSIPLINNLFSFFVIFLPCYLLISCA